MELRIRILAGIADVFDGLGERVDAAAAARAAAEALAADGGANAAAGAATGQQQQQRRAPGIDADAVRWAVGTSLSHVGKSSTALGSCFRICWELSHYPVLHLILRFIFWHSLIPTPLPLFTCCCHHIIPQAPASGAIQIWSRPSCDSSRVISPHLPTMPMLPPAWLPSATFA